MIHLATRGLWLRMNFEKRMSHPQNRTTVAHFNFNKARTITFTKTSPNPIIQIENDYATFDLENHTTEAKSTTSKDVKHEDTQDG
jgi:hypothetical protein